MIMVEFKTGFQKEIQLNVNLKDKKISFLQNVLHWNTWHK